MKQQDLELVAFSGVGSRKGQMWVENGCYTCRSDNLLPPALVNTEQRSQQALSEVSATLFWGSLCLATCVCGYNLQERGRQIFAASAWWTSSQRQHSLANNKGKVDAPQSHLTTVKIKLQNGCGFQKRCEYFESRIWKTSLLCVSLSLINCESMIIQGGDARLKWRSHDQPNLR